MTKQSFVIVRDCKLPSVNVNNTNPHRPNQISWRKYRKGMIIHGEIKHENNKPAFIMSEGIVVPLYCAKAIITKEIVSSATGQEVADAKNKEVIKEATTKVRYLDSAIVGAVVGCAIVWFANKKQWIKVPQKEHYLYGALGGALLGAYIIYRTNNTKKVKIIRPE